MLTVLSLGKLFPFLESLGPNIGHFKKIRVLYIVYNLLTKYIRLHNTYGINDIVDYRFPAVVAMEP